MCVTDLCHHGTPTIPKPRGGTVMLSSEPIGILNESPAWWRSEKCQGGHNSPALGEVFS